MGGSTLVAPRTVSMSQRTTTLKIPDDLKKSIDEAAAAADQSAHAYMLEALLEKTRLDAQRRSFVADAVAAREETRRTGKAYAAVDVHRYIRARARGEKVAKPKPISWRK